MSARAPLAAALLVALGAASPQGGEGAGELVVRSPGGLFVARLAKAPGQERVRDALARWKLEVRDADGQLLWSCFHPPPDAAARHLLAEDGSALVILAPRWSDSRPVVSLRSGEDPPARVFGGELGIPRAALRDAQPPGAWLAEAPDAARFAWVLGPQGPRQVLELVCLDGEVRTIDLASGRPTAAGGGAVRVWVEPPYVPDEDVVPPPRVPSVREFGAPARVAGDEALVVQLRGDHPNPGWRVCGFTLEPGADTSVLVLQPWARPPLPPGLTLQQIEPYRTEARVHGLPPGEYVLLVEGRDGPVGEPWRFAVEPGGVLAKLHTTGGILGLDETLTVFANGVVERISNRGPSPRRFFAAPRAFAEARSLLSRLAPLQPREGPSAVSDALRFELTWRAAGGWRVATANEPGVRGELREAIDALRRLGPP